jgi:hypothetical protein
MSEIKNEKFDLEFIERTKKIIEEYNGLYEITLLLNCLLGLIVLPSEYYTRKSRSFFEIELNQFDELKGLLDDAIFNPTKRNKGKWIADNKNLKTLIKKVRNGVSHQQIECIGNDGIWQSVIIKDINKSNKNNVELHVCWTTNQIKAFALFVANSYLIQSSNLDILVKNEKSIC